MTVLTDKTDFQVDLSDIPFKDGSSDGANMPSVAYSPNAIDISDIPFKDETLQESGESRPSVAAGIAGGLKQFASDPSPGRLLERSAIAQFPQTDAEVASTIKLAVTNPYEFLTGVSTVPGTTLFKQFTDEDKAVLAGKPFAEIMREAWPGTAESPAVAEQFAVNLLGEMVDWGTKPSSWVILGAMSAAGGPVMEEVSKGMAKNFPRTYEFLTKQRGASAQVYEKIARGETLTAKEQAIITEQGRKAAKISAREATAHKAASTARNAELRKNIELRRQFKLSKGERIYRDPIAQDRALVRFDPEFARGQTIQSPITNKPITVYDSRVTMELPRVVTDAAGKPVTLGVNQVAVNIEGATGAIETIAMGVPDVAPVVAAKATASAAKEALNYATAEEYVEAQGEVVYHAGKSGIPEKMIPHKGFHVGTEKAATERMGEEKRTIHKLVVSSKNPYKPNGKILDERNAEDRTTLYSLQHLESKRNALLAEGYDSIPYINAVEDKGSVSYMVLDKGILKTKAQLTAEWNAAQAAKVVPADGPADVEAVQALKSITEVVNGYTNRGEPVPDSLLKRQRAMLLEVAGKSGRNIPVSKILGVEPSADVATTEAKLLRERFRNLARGYREGKKVTKEQIADNINTVKQMLDDSKLEPKDLEKFTDRLTNISKMAQQEEMFKRTVLSIESRIAELELAQEKRVLNGAIKKELKYTKPVKKGAGVRKGKYNPEENKTFAELRNIRKMTQEQAQSALESMPTMDVEPLDIIKTRLLSLQANGMGSSVEMRIQILEDMRNLKAAAKTAKTEADFQKAMNRNEKVEEVLAGVKRVKGNAKTVATKVTKTYLSGAGNLYSDLNAMAGKPIAQKYNPEVYQSRMKTAIYYKDLERTIAWADILELPSPEHLPHALVEMGKLDYRLSRIGGPPLEISKNHIIHIYNSLKNPITRKQYFNSYGEAQIQDLVAQLTPQERAAGDYLMELLRPYRPVFNDHHVQRTGLDLGRVDPYWPAVSRKQPNVFDDIRQKSNIPTAERARSKSPAITPKPQNAWTVAGHHIVQGEHVRHLSKRYEDLKRIFTDIDVEEHMVSKFGKDAYDHLMRQIERISLNRYSEADGAVAEGYGFLVNNWAKSKVALNTSAFLRQWASMINFSENMPVGQWAEALGKSVTGGKETLDYMWKRFPGLESRFNMGYSEIIAEGLKSASHLKTALKSKSAWLTSFSRVGDVGAIIYGGKPYVDYLDSTGMPKEEVDLLFESEALQTQQSPHSTGRSDWQNSSNAVSRQFLAFKNTPNQYVRKLGDAIIAHSNGDITTEQLAKIITIYGIVNPAVYSILSTRNILIGAAAVGVIAGLKDGDEESAMGDLTHIRNNVIVQIATSPFQIIPILDDASEYAVKKILGESPWKVFNTPIFDELERVAQVLNKVEITGMDWAKIVGPVFELGLGLPVSVGAGYYKLAKDLAGDDDSLEKRLKE